MSAVEVVAPVTIDPANAEVTTTTPAAGELSMADYAAKLEAEIRGETPPAVEKPAEPAAATDETAAPADADKPADEVDEENPEQQIEETHPARRGIGKKFAKLTERATKAEQDAAAKTDEAAKARKEADDALAEVARMKAEAEARAAAVPVVPKAEDDPMPDRDQFDDPDAYAAAIAAHAARVEIRKANDAAQVRDKAAREDVARKDQEAQQARVTAQITELHKGFNERVAAAAPDYPDYAEKVTNNENLTLRNDVFFTIERSEMAPHILYHLAGHPDEAARLNGLDPVSAAIRLGELQAEIRIARRPKPSAAAKPITPIGSRPNPERKTIEEETMEETAARITKEEQARRRARH